MKEKLLPNIVLSMLLILLGLVSFFFISDAVSAPDGIWNQSNVASLDEKSETVLKLSGATALASVGVSALKGDMATPIAEQLADFTKYFLIILSVLFAEKYLLSIIGTVAFKILIPISCILLSIFLFKGNRKLKDIALKLGAFGLAIFIMIPCSLWVSDAIYKTYENKIETTIDNANDFTEKTDAISQANNDQGVIASILNKISETVTSLSDKASNLLNNFVESLAIMIVTSCIIPLLVVIFFLWLAKTLLGIEIPKVAIGKLGKKKEEPAEIETTK